MLDKALQQSWPCLGQRSTGKTVKLSIAWYMDSAGRTLVSLLGKDEDENERS